MLGKSSQRTQCYGHCWIRFLLNCWLLKGCFPFPVTSHVAGLLNSSLSTPKLRNPFGTMCKVYYMGRKADEMLTVQPSTFLRCHKYHPCFLVLQPNTPIRQAPDLKCKVPLPIAHRWREWADSIPSMGLGTKCDEGLVFFTRFPFII